MQDGDFTLFYNHTTYFSTQWNPQKQRSRLIQHNPREETGFLLDAKDNGGKAMVVDLVIAHVLVVT